MPKVYLSFNLPDEQAEMDCALRAGKYCSVIWEFSMWLREKYKYEEKETLPTDEVRAKLYELLNDKGIGDEF